MNIAMNRGVSAFERSLELQLPNLVKGAIDAAKALLKRT
jgi:hypothetical protein